MGRRRRGPAIAAVNTSLQTIEALGSFECPPRNSIPREQLSEHGRANALDVRSFKLTDGAVIRLTSASVASRCAEEYEKRVRRFRQCWATGGCLSRHHVHVDLMERA